MNIECQILYTLFLSAGSSFEVIDVRRDKARVIEVYNDLDLPYLRVILGGSSRRVYRIAVAGNE
jgi:hypothetical protein